MCAIEDFQCISFSQNFILSPMTFFYHCFYIHLIKAQLNSCDSQADEVLNFCKRFFLEKRLERESSNILKQNSMTYCRHRGSCGVWIFPEYCCLDKGLHSFKARTLPNSILCLRPTSSGPWHVCMYIWVCMNVYMHVGCVSCVW